MQSVMMSECESLVSPTNKAPLCKTPLTHSHTPHTFTHPSHIHTPLTHSHTPHSEDSSDVDSDEFFDADAELETFDHVITSPSLSVPIPEGDPSDVEEDEEIIEEDNTSGDSHMTYSNSVD